MYDLDAIQDAEESENEPAEAVMQGAEGEVELDDGIATQEDGQAKEEAKTSFPRRPLQE